MTRATVSFTLRTDSISTHILTRRMTFFPPFRQMSMRISTHILTRRMTRQEKKFGRHHINFNSHPHKEDDRCLMRIIHTIRHFNSHPHKEDDKGQSLLQPFSGHFNSHPHKEDDGQERVVCLEFIISTHILTRRMTIVPEQLLHSL